MTKTGIIISDMHCGARNGLTPPAYQADKFKALSVPLWAAYKDIIDSIGSVDIVICNGDAVDGMGKGNGGIEHSVTNPMEQAEIAIECLDQISFKKIYFTAGTGYHVAYNYRYEKPIADNYHTELFDTLRLDINGCRFNVRHTIGTSQTPYGMATQVYKEVVRIMLDDYENDIDPSDVIIRSHAHQYWEVKRPGKVGIVTPCLQFPDSIYGNKMRSWYYTMGLLSFQVTDDGEFSYKEHLIQLTDIKPKGYIKA